MSSTSIGEGGVQPPEEIKMPGEPEGKPAKPQGWLGRTVSWVKGYNTYIPVVSTVTGAVKAIAGVLWGGAGLLGVGIGAVQGVLSVVMPKEQWSEFLLARSAQNITKGVNMTCTGLRGTLRGAISAVPVAGNLVVLGKDWLEGRAGKDTIADPVYRAALSVFRKMKKGHTKGAVEKAVEEQKQEQRRTAGRSDEKNLTRLYPGTRAGFWNHLTPQWTCSSGVIAQPQREGPVKYLSSERPEADWEIVKISCLAVDDRYIPFMMGIEAK